MSRPLRCLSSSLRSFSNVSTSSPIPHRGTLARKYSVAAMKMRPEESSKSSRIPQRARRTKNVDEEEWSGRRDEVQTTSRRRTAEKAETVETVEERAAEEETVETWNGPQKTWNTSTEQLTSHLHDLFPELQFPDEVAKRILTHGSHPAAIYGHNAAFSFMGRRVMESYLLLMLTASKKLKPTANVDEVVARTLNSYTLGEHVGSKWALGRVMRWTPSVAARELKKEGDQKELLRSVGLYKVQGDAVGAVVGGVFFQFGASVAHRLFHTRVLPHLVGKGLPASFEADVQDICNRMGGVEGKLVQVESPPPQPTEQASLKSHNT